MSAMDTDELSVVLPSTTVSGLSLALHPLPILNISEHLTRLKLQKKTNTPFVLGALLGTQNGRDVEIVNTFELAVEADESQVFPSLEFIGWYTVAPKPTLRHVMLQEQFTGYCSTPLLLLLQPGAVVTSSDVNAQSLPFRAYEPTMEIRDRVTRSVFVEVAYSVETGEAERIAVDWTAKGGGSGTSLESHLQTQRAAVKMLHDRILILVKYVSEAIAGHAKKDPGILRDIAALLASLPATENRHFRQEFDTEYEDVQLTAYLSSLTKSTHVLNDLVDKHVLMTANSREDRGPMMAARRRKGGMFPGESEWGRIH
ncbi:hypothetical protein FISHEDRAFT_69607 [Fistulina hepatica ATCC 64428]|uniref:COP9 signalosome complex subunit 6 n=1 Tax=Fistulina hepatica ATCC 64428 TaxID=1128425 RepID=A0A0D7AM28_9AGAR|nr:hypothetical protein FISHEDRAFT_69607 [Fistulina hepatica ATCC 64428]